MPVEKVFPTCMDIFPSADSLGSCRESREADRRLNFEQLVSSVSLKLINATAKEVDQAIMDALKQVRDGIQVDHLGLITVLREKTEVIFTHFTHRDGLHTAPEKVDIGLLFPWAKTKLLHGEIISFTSLDELPSGACVDRQSWQKLRVNTCFSLPIHVAGSIKCSIVVAHAQSARKMDTRMLPRLRLLGEIFANALVRCSSETVQQTSRPGIQHENTLLPEQEYQPHLVPSQHYDEIVGQSEALTRVMALTEQVAPTDSTVLIYGETGTGKELIAQQIHKLSMRRKKEMVTVNCASLPAALVESELFGREKGAYTGALTRQAGRFELADGGSIFLDEVAEMPLELQAKLLRVLQEGQFERLGSVKTLTVNVRVIAATNRDLAEEVKKGNFREDLYYRLNVFPIVVPPLRERIEDIPILVWAFIREFGEKMGKQINRIAKQDMAALQSYSWPGNVRELRNVIEHAAIVSTDERLQVRVPENKPKEVSGIRTLEEFETMHIREALRLTGGRVKGDGGAAKLLGLNPSTLYSRMQKLGITPRESSVG